MYLLVHHLDGALAGSPQTEATAEKPLLRTTLTWQVRTCRPSRMEAPTHLQLQGECSCASHCCFSTPNSGVTTIGTQLTGW